MLRRCWIGYNTDMTTDEAGIEQVLSRARARHEAVAREAYGRFTPVALERVFNSLDAIAEGRERGFRIFDASTDEHLITTTVPANMSGEELDDHIASFKRNFADQTGLREGVELAHVSIECDEARALMDRV